MNKSIRIILFIGFLAAVLHEDLCSQGLPVKNVRYTRQDKSKIVVTYDLLGKSSSRYEIRLFLSDSKYRRPFLLKQNATFGDLGKNISPGKNKQIVWDMNKSRPVRLDPNDLVFMIDARLQKGGTKWPWIVSGVAAVGGGLAYLFLAQQKTGQDSKGTLIIEVPEQP